VRSCPCASPLYIVLVRSSGSLTFYYSLNSRDNLRETLDGPDCVVATLTQLKARTGTLVPWGAQDTTEASTNTAVPNSFLPLSVSSDMSFSDSVIAFDRVKYPVTPVAGV